jgi:hypothetical protein
VILRSRRFLKRIVFCGFGYVHSIASKANGLSWLALSGHYVPMSEYRFTAPGTFLATYRQS